MRQEPNTYVLSLGGSVFAPNGEVKGINIDYLKKFERFIRKQVAAGRRFFIVTGGGYTARLYRDAAAEVVGKDKVEDEDLDWLGVHATRINAHLFRTIFKDITSYRFLKHYDVVDKNVLDYPVVICSGWKPGWSTDYCSVLVAHDYGVKTVINLSNIDMVYDADPKTNGKAKPIAKMGWDKLISIVGRDWKPGMNAPFDPIASKLAKKTKLKVVVADGHDLKNLEKILEGKDYVGTTIE
jgi:uridylate kinase